MRINWPTIFLPKFLARAAVPILLGILMGTAAAQGSTSDDAKRRLLDQKIRLLDQLLGAPAAKKAATGADQEAAQLIVQAGTAVGQARQALAESRLDAAASLLDEGMRSAGKATRRMQSESALSESAQRKTYDEQSEQVASYRASASELTGDAKMGPAASELIVRLDTLSAEAVRLATAQRLGEANRKLAEAYKLATEEIARLRQGQEVVMTLKFNTPADEYAYEQKRFNSNEIMVDMLITEGKADGERRSRVDRLLDEARQLKRRAEASAGATRYPEALSEMEKANDQMKRALQAMGIAVF